MGTVGNGQVSWNTNYTYGEDHFSGKLCDHYMIVWRGFNVQSPTSCNTAKAQLLIDIAVDENPGIGNENQIIKFIVEEEQSFGIDHYFTISYDSSYVYHQ